MADAVPEPDAVATEGTGPSGPLLMEDYEEEARRRLTKTAFDYYAGGAGEEWTLRQNREAFRRWVIRPRVLVDVSEVDTATQLLGEEIPFPILLAPTAFQRLGHVEGELATARAAASLGALMVVSTIATASMEEIAQTNVKRWFQLYIHRDRDLTRQLVERATEAGYGAIVLTVDTPFVGRRPRDERNEFSLPPGIALANLTGLELPEGVGGSGLFAYFASQIDPALTWGDIEWLRSISPLPVLIKGVLTAEAARQGMEAGVDGIVVSNHGGRQLDGVPASLDALPEVVDAVGGRVPVLMDSGVRSGADVLKALALGANAVLIGRPYLWGLAVDGERGVRRVVKLLANDLSLTMALAGVASLKEIDRSLVAPAP